MQGAMNRTSVWLLLAFVLPAEGCAGYWGRRSLDQSTPVDSMTLGYHTGVERVATAAGTVTAVVGMLAAATFLDGVVCYLLDRGDPQC